jgi:cathepsin A (carboxypeptidase C)
MGNGPCKLNRNGNSTIINPYSWNNNANIIYLDQPLGAGYSYGKGGGDNTISSMEQVYAFLQLFFQKFPKYKNLDFHAFGESYGGHYIPYLGKLINDNNKKPYVSKINLKSIGIGNGLINPLIQSESYPVMACNNTYHPVLPQSTCDYMSDHLPNCTSLIAECNKNMDVETCINANNYCQEYISAPYVMAGLNTWDIRNKCEIEGICYTILANIQNYFNRKDIKQALGANININFTIFSDPVYEKFTNQGDFALDFGKYTTELLNDGIRTLIYNGDADFVCNWYGGKAWALGLDWIHKAKFNNAKDLTWKSQASSKEFGQYRTYGDFTFLRVYESGHFVPYSQPEAALDMINRWINKTPF